MAEEKRRKRRKRQAGTSADKLAIFLDRIEAWGDFEEGVAALETWEKRGDLETAFGGIFADGGLLELGAQRFSGFRPRELCWLWKHNTADGRPRMRIDGKLTFVTRWVYTKIYGPPPPGTIVAHRCDQSTCIRPDHLVLLPRNAPAYMGKKRKAARDA